MCGRYYVDDETAREIEKLVKEVDEKLAGQRKKTDIHPTDPAIVLRAAEETLRGKADRRELWLTSDRQYWGFPAAEKSGIIFNARSETAAEKPMFRESLAQRRIVVPARGFYEWGKDRTKYRFVPKDGKPLYMAGIYRCYGEQGRFVILTAEADEIMQPVHDRMPVLLREGDMREWVQDEKAAVKLMKEKNVKLERLSDYEQMTFSLN